MHFIWREGGLMLLVAAIGLVAAGGNVYFAATQSMQVGEKLRRQIFSRSFMLFPPVPDGSRFPGL